MCTGLLYSVRKDETSVSTRDTVYTKTLFLEVGPTQTRDTSEGDRDRKEEVTSRLCTLPSDPAHTTPGRPSRGPGSGPPTPS